MHSRNPALVLLLTVLCLAPSGSALADDDLFEAVALVTPGAVYSDVDGLDVDLGLGAGFGWQFRPLWGLDSRVSFDDGNGIERQKFDLGLRRSLQSWGDWSTHLSFGVHHRETDLDFGPCGAPGIFCRSRGRESESATGAFFGYDADWSFREATSLRLDGRYSVFDSDDSLSLSVGLAFRF